MVYPQFRRLRFLVSVIFLGVYLLMPVAVSAGSDLGEDFPDIAVHGMLYFNYQNPNGEKTAANGEGLGKLSYNNGTGGSDIFNLDQAALAFQARLNWSWSSAITAKYSDRQINPVDLSEAMLLYKPVSTSKFRFSARLGAFFPPISMENTGMAWTSPYTLSNSAINSWVGEELKVFGAEASINYLFTDSGKLGLFAAAFGNNDTAGVLLAWRGWNLDNYTATLNDRFSLPRASSIQSFFPKQANYTEPFSEVDGKPGYYIGISFEQAALGKIRALYYDNRGKPNAVQNGQYAWHTRFGSLGLKKNLPWDIELLSQAMLGRTQMGEQMAGLYAVDSSFWAASWLLSKKSGPHRFSARYEIFGASENDYLPKDSNSEDGFAWTVNYNFTFAEQHQFNFEFVNIESFRPSRASLSENLRQNDTLWQVAYRWFF
jgi:hypothetical protein